MTTDVPRARAARLHAHGKPLVVEEVDILAPADGDVVVEMAFAGVNPVDRYIAEGRVAPDVPLPRTSGWRAPAAGAGDGRPVLVHGGGLGTKRDGAWAERVVVPRAAPHRDSRRRRSGRGGRHGRGRGDGLAHGHGSGPGDSRRPGAGARRLRRRGQHPRLALPLARRPGLGPDGQSRQSGLRHRPRGPRRSSRPPPADLAAAVEPLAPTVVFDALGDGFSAAAIEALEPFGRLVSFGVSAGPMAEVNMQNLYRKGLTVYGYGGLIEPAERMAAGKAAALAALADGRLRVAVAERAPAGTGQRRLRRPRRPGGQREDRARPGRITRVQGSVSRDRYPDPPQRSRSFQGEQLVRRIRVTSEKKEMLRRCDASTPSDEEEV